MKNNNHIFRSSKSLNLQDKFIFVDTESKTTQITKEKQRLTFYLCCGIFWNKKTNMVIRNIYYNVSEFWNDIETFFCERKDNIILFAHNCQFDFKMLDGFNQLFNRNWQLVNFYIKNKVFILVFKKNDFTLHIWDTMNYFTTPKSVKDLGNSIGLPKLDVDLNNISDDNLEIYCKRDTEIIFQFVKRLILFLQEKSLTKLKATAGSLSFNTFRHKFYKDYKNPLDSRNICIHDWKQSIRLERESYHGGISECYKLGKFKDIYKLDINSMYPKTMKDKRLPIRLIAYRHESSCNQDYLFKLYNKCKNNKFFGVIANVSIYLPLNCAYILSDYGLGKTSFCYSKNETDLLQVSLCNPELEFIENNGGKIVKIHEINVYYMKYIFKRFVSFFYDLKTEYKLSDDKVSTEFCKLIMNANYGKWGQREIEIEVVKANTEFIKENEHLIKLMIESAKEKLENKELINMICYLGIINNEYELYILNRQLYKVKYTLQNTKESFVAISSFITSYSRVMLIDYLLKAKRDNVIYSDTDSLFCNQAGYDNLSNFNCISETELGKLKIEGYGNCQIYAPKFYDFNDIRKAKGIKKGSILLNENEQKAIYEIEYWQKYKTDLKKGNINEQIIIKTVKEINKIYDKGKVINNIVYPYSQKEIKKIGSI